MRKLRALKRASYLCGTALVLSLPALTYVIPTPESGDQGTPIKGSYKSRPPVHPSPRQNLAGSVGKRNRAPQTQSDGSNQRLTPGSSSLMQPPMLDMPANHRSRALASDAPEFPEQSQPQSDEAGRARPAAGFREGIWKVFDPGPSSGDLPLEVELLELEKGFETASRGLFGDGAFGQVIAINPFQEKLDQEPLPGPDSPQNEPPSDPTDAAVEGPDTDRSTRGQDGIDGVEGRGRAPSDYDLLIVGEFSGLENKQVFRADWDESGSFILEGSFELSLFLGIGENFLLYEGEEQVVTSRRPGGLMDFFVARTTPLGTSLDWLIQDASGEFEEEAHGVLFGRSVTSFTVFDLDSDGQLELLLVIKDAPNLVIFSRSGDRLRYSRELSLPFAPGFILNSVGLFGQEFMQVFDSQLRQSASLIPQRGQLYVRTALGVPSRFQSFDLPFQAGEGIIRALVSKDQNRIVLAAQRGGRLILHANLDVSRKMPFAIFGDLQKSGSPQLLLLP